MPTKGILNDTYFTLQLYVCSRNRRFDGGNPTDRFLRRG